MPIYRVQKDKNNPYTPIRRATLQDKRLSWKARGILAFLLSLPDNWKIHLESIAEQSERDGRDLLASGMQELIDAGYVVRTQQRREDGRLGDVEYDVYETSKTAPPKNKIKKEKPVNAFNFGKYIAESKKHAGKEFAGTLPRWARVLKKLETTLGEDVAFRAFAKYIEATPAMFMSPYKFEETVACYMDKAQPQREMIGEDAAWTR